MKPHSHHTITFHIADPMVTNTTKQQIKSHVGLFSSVHLVFQVQFGEFGWLGFVWFGLVGLFWQDLFGMFALVDLVLNFLNNLHILHIFYLSYSARVKSYQFQKLLRSLGQLWFLNMPTRPILPIPSHSWVPSKLSDVQMALDLQ